ncbi:MAG: hypothetical protein ACE10H_01350 [Candidatus Binatia bacterium]
MIDSLLALHTKLKGGKCLIYIGREGRTYMPRLHEITDAVQGKAEATRVQGNVVD